MRARPSLCATAITILSACAGGGPPEPPSLAWEMPSGAGAVYLQGDTAEVDVDAGGQTMEVSVASQATLDMTFRPGSEGDVRVTTVIRDVSGRATNPMAPTQTVRTERLQGELVFSVDRRGEPTVEETPMLEGTVEEFVSPEVLVATLFPRLPGRAVQPGERWTDTVHVGAEQPRSSVTGTSVLTYTAVGDTTVAGRSMVHVTFTGEDERHVEGSRSGFDVTQDLTGTSVGWFLWDVSRGLPWASVHDATLSGTMDVSAAPFPLSVRVRSKMSLQLQDGTEGGS